MADAHARAQEPSVQPGGIPAAAEQRTPPAIIALQRSAGNAAVSGMLARDPKPANEERFELGKDIGLPLAKAAKRLAAKPIGDAELLQLHDKALEDDQSISEPERLFMTALMAQQNRDRLLAATLNAGEKLSLVLPRDAATIANQRHVADLRRPDIDPDVTAALDDAADARPDKERADKAGKRAHDAAEKQIAALAGTNRRRAATLIGYAEKQGVALPEVLASMINTASDSTPGDLVSAGIVFAVAAAVNHPAAALLRAGRLKVDEMPLEGAVARYSPTTDRGKADTIYVTGKLDIADLEDRGTVIHELEHAMQDAGAPATGLPKFVERDKLEVEAYRAEALYTLRQIAALPAGDERKTAALQIARHWGVLHQRAALLAAKADASLVSVLKEVNGLAGDAKLPDAELKGLLDAPATADEGKIKLEVWGMPGMQLDGLRGETRLSRKRFTDATHDAERFKIGVELTPGLAQAAWEQTRAGALDDTGLGALRAIALANGETIDDNERLFMAALLDPVNARRFHAENAAGFSGDGKEIWFLTSTITGERRKHVADFGRDAQPGLEKRPGDGSNDALDRQMHAMVGNYTYALPEILAMADAAKIPHLNVQMAMVAAASDSTPPDRYFAGAVYVIARRAGLDLAGDVLSGRLKVDAVFSSYMPHAYEAMYQSSAEAAKGDTLYLPWTLDPSTLAGQGTILHELTHAADDKAAATITSAPAAEGELKAYRAEARFYLAELMKIAEPAKRREAADKTGKAFAPPQIWALVLEARALPEDEEHDPFEIVRDLNGAGFPVKVAEVERALLSNSDEVNLRKAVAAIDKAYGFKPGATKQRDGLRGESSLD